MAGFQYPPLGAYPSEGTTIIFSDGGGNFVELDTSTGRSGLPAPEAQTRLIEGVADGSIQRLDSGDTGDTAEPDDAAAGDTAEEQDDPTPLAEWLAERGQKHADVETPEEDASEAPSDEEKEDGPTKKYDSESKGHISTNDESAIFEIGQAGAFTDPPRDHMSDLEGEAEVKDKKTPKGHMSDLHGKASKVSEDLYKKHYGDEDNEDEPEKEAKKGK
jgi:hypothetical protein